MRMCEADGKGDAEDEKEGGERERREKPHHKTKRDNAAPHYQDYNTVMQ